MNLGVGSPGRYQCNFLVVGNILIAAALLSAGGHAQTPANVETQLQMYHERDRCAWLRSHVDNLTCQIGVYTRYGDYNDAAVTRRELAVSEGNEQCANDASPIVEYKCRIKIDTKYGAADELSRDKDWLAKLERDQNDAEIRREDKLRAQAEHVKRCQQAPRISIGITADQVIVSDWGSPSDRNTTTTAAHQREQWVYDFGPDCRPTSKPAFLYFDNGVLTAIQD